jgi:putative DNA primase/helicase
LPAKPALTPEQQYVRKGTKDKRSKQPEQDSALAGRMAAHAIKQIPKEYNPWDDNDLNEDDLAEDIVQHCGRYIRHCAENGWMGWSAEDGCWKGEEYAESMVQWIVRHFGRLLSENVTDEYPEGIRFARHVRSSGGINAIMSILRRDKRIAFTYEQFDADPSVLNCKGALYNLRTGSVRPVEPEDYITKSMSCKPAEAKGKDQPTMPAQFLDFMKKITSKDGEERQDLAKWILFYFGYSLTGETGASFFVNFHGGGQNGKSVLLKTMMSIFGDYASPISHDIVIENRFASQFDLAGLPGIRLGVLADAGEGQLNMKLLKEVTTGEPISAKRKFKKDFLLRAVCKLAVGTNHQLNLKNTGMDAKRRIRMVPFDWTVPDEEIVPDLEKKLIEEAPEILRLLIYFAGRYYSKGGGAKAFPACEIIDEASREYLASQDLVGRWVKNNTEEAPGNGENVDDLYRNFTAWCGGEGIKKVMGKNKFGEHLSVHIKEKKRDSKGIIYLNIRLTGSSPPLPDKGGG